MSEDVSNLEPHFDEDELRRCAAFFRGYAKTLATWLPKNLSFRDRSNGRAETLLRAIEAYDALRERCLLAETKLAQLTADERETRPVQWRGGDVS